MVNQLIWGILQRNITISYAFIYNSTICVILSLIDAHIYTIRNGVFLRPGVFFVDNGKEAGGFLSGEPISLLLVGRDDLVQFSIITNFSDFGSGNNFLLLCQISPIIQVSPTTGPV